MPVNTAYLSDQTTDFTSDVSIAGRAVLAGALDSASAISAGAITGTTGAFTSTLSADGAVTLQGAVTHNAAYNSSSALSAGPITGSTGTFNSAVSVDGAVTLQGVVTHNAAYNSASAVSAGALTGTSGTFSSFVSVGADLDMQGNRVLSILTITASGATSNMTDGEVLLSDVSDLGAQLAWRSGNTTYLFLSTGTA